MSNDTQPLKPWLVPIIPDDSTALSTSLLVEVPGLATAGVYVMQGTDGWYGWAEWRERGAWKQGAIRGPFDSPTQTELACRQDLEKERAKHEQSERQ